jgi:hypothetical protein
MPGACIPKSSRAVGLVVPMPTLPAKELFPAPVWVRRPEESVRLPEVRVKFLPEAMVVSPFKDTAPVPVPKVPLPVCVKLELFCTVTAPLEVSPEVAVINPEMVGVAVQIVGLMVKVVADFPKLVEVELVVPRFKAPAESTARVPEVAVWIVKSPAVLVQADVPPEAKVKAFAPVDTDEVDKPDKDKAPEVAVKFNAPVVKAKPFEAVKVEENLPVPVTSSAAAGAVVPMPTLPSIIAPERGAAILP